MPLVDINWDPNSRQLRLFAAVGAAMMTGIATWVFLRHGFLWMTLAEPTARIVATVLWAVSAAFVVCCAAVPKVILPVYIVLTVVALPIGYVLSMVMMLVVYYGIFTPIGLVFRLIGRDSLHRRFDPQSETYWVSRHTVTDVRRYFRQF